MLLKTEAIYKKFKAITDVREENKKVQRKETSFCPLTVMYNFIFFNKIILFS